MPFEKNIFINCPFDNSYKPLLKSLIFCLLYLDFEPKLSQNYSSANIRINQIKNLILNSKFGIHDISRCKPINKNELPRFNMPFELGLDLGCYSFKGGKHKFKKILIFETKRHYYQKVISDIAGQDIVAHNDNPKKIIEKARDWISTMKKAIIPGGTAIWIAYNQFLHDLVVGLKKEKYSLKEIDDMPYNDYIKFSKRWINSFKK